MPAYFEIKLLFGKDLLQLFIQKESQIVQKCILKIFVKIDFKIIYIFYWPLLFFRAVWAKESWSWSWSSWRKNSSNSVESLRPIEKSIPWRSKTMVSENTVKESMAILVILIIQRDKTLKINFKCFKELILVSFRMNYLLVDYLDKNVETENSPKTLEKTKIRFNLVLS